MSQGTGRHPRPSLTDTLLVQTDKAGWRQAAECADRPGGGLVLTGEASLPDAASLLRDGYPRPVLVDRARYTGRRRKLAKDPFDPDWIRRQTELPVAAVVTDSGYIGPADHDGLRAVLTASAELTARLGQSVVAVLPLHHEWLAVTQGLGTLISEVSQAQVPIAVVMEHAGDPLGARWAVDGLIRLLTVPVPVMVLRCDLAALGALAYGAVAAAVGTRTSLRHLYPVTDNTGPPPIPRPAAIVKPCLAYYPFDKINRIVQTDPDNPWWCCPCDQCAGRRLDRLSSLPDPDTAASAHSLHVLYAIRDDIMGRRATAGQRRQSWAAQCSHALAVHHDIARATSGWRPPPGLKPWADRLTPSPPRPSRPEPGFPGRPVPPWPG